MGRIGNLHSKLYYATCLLGADFRPHWWAAPRRLGIRIARGVGGSWPSNHVWEPQGKWTHESSLLGSCQRGFQLSRDPNTPETCLQRHFCLCHATNQRQVSLFLSISLGPKVSCGWPIGEVTPRQGWAPLWLPLSCQLASSSPFHSLSLSGAACINLIC